MAGITELFHPLRQFVESEADNAVPRWTRSESSSPVQETDGKTREEPLCLTDSLVQARDLVAEEVGKSAGRPGRGKIPSGHPFVFAPGSFVRFCVQGQVFLDQMCESSLRAQGSTLCVALARRVLAARDLPYAGPPPERRRPTLFLAVVRPRDSSSVHAIQRPLRFSRPVPRLARPTDEVCLLRGVEIPRGNPEDAPGIMLTHRSAVLCSVLTNR